MKISGLLLRRGGFSLFEVLIGLVLVGVMVPSSLIVFQQVLVNKTKAEARIQCVNLAQMVMEHETQKRFSAIESIPLTNFEAATLAGGGANPYRDNDLAMQFVNFNFQVDVDCIHDGANGMNTNLDAWPAVACNGEAAEYKRIAVTVTNPLAEQVRLTSVVTDVKDPSHCQGTTADDALDCGIGTKACAGAGDAAGIFLCVPDEAACPCPFVH